MRSRSELGSPPINFSHVPGSPPLLERKTPRPNIAANTRLGSRGSRTRSVPDLLRTDRLGGLRLRHVIPPSVDLHTPRSPRGASPVKLEGLLIPANAVAA